jgi:UDP-N-acetylglucosamine 2-epimerase
MLKVLSIVGARPQFIKAAPVSKALRQAGYSEFPVYTGQHYDHGTSQVFFQEMGIPGKTFSRRSWSVSRKSLMRKQ